MCQKFSDKGMFVTILAKVMLLRACVCYSLAKCCWKIKEDDEEARRRRCRKVLYEGF